MMKPLPLVLAMTCLAAIASKAAAQSDDPSSLDDTPHITIVGSAAAEVPPDLATITLGVDRHALTAGAAAAATAAAARAIVDEAKAEGTAGVDIATQSVTLSQAFEEKVDPQGRSVREPAGFDAANIISIRVRDLSKAGTLAQSLIEKGANTLNGIAFSVEHPQPTLDRLAGEAVAAAGRRAETIARAAGIRLGRVLLVERPQASSREPRIAPMARMATAAMPVEAGVETLSQDMEVTWEIVQP